MTPGGNIIPKTLMLVDDVDLTKTMYAGEEAVLDGQSVEQ